MNFTKTEREVLKSLSYKIFGRTSKWEKILKTTKYRVEGQFNTVKRTTYEYVNQKGTIMYNGAKDLKLPVVRSMTFNEILSYLVNLLDYKVVSIIEKQNPEFLSQLYATRLVKQELAYSFQLVKELTDEELDESLKDLPDYVVDVIKSSSVSTVDSKKGSVFNQKDFIDYVKNSMNETHKIHKTVDEQFNHFIARLENNA